MNDCLNPQFCQYVFSCQNVISNEFDCICVDAYGEGHFCNTGFGFEFCVFEITLNKRIKSGL